MRYLVNLALLLATSMSYLSHGQEPMVIKYVSNVGLSEEYYVKLLDRAMQITEPEYGPYRIDFSQQPLSSERKHELMIAGDQINVDRIVGLPLKGSVAGALIKINFQLLRGLMGVRVPLIRAESQLKFDAVNSLVDLKPIPMGIGKGWEGYIYKHQNFQMVEPVTFDMLLKMLAGGRYDFVPLGVCEIQRSYKVQGIDIDMLVPERRLLIAYNLPTHFYVSPAEAKLAERLQKGLSKIDRNGEAVKIFDSFFAAHLKSLNVKNRKVIELINPELPADQQKLDLSILKSY